MNRKDVSDNSRLAVWVNSPRGSGVESRRKKHLGEFLNFFIYVNASGGSNFRRHFSFLCRKEELKL